jgi:signal transduction histidine kinase
VKWFNLQNRDRSSNILTARDARAVLTALRKLLSEVVDDLNNNLQDTATKLSVGQPITTQDSENGKNIETIRIQVSNKLSGLSVRARGAQIDLFLLPATQLCLAPSTEYPSRLKFRLEKSENHTWLLDGKEVSEADLKLLILTVTNDLLKHSAQGSNPTEPGTRLKIGDMSLTTGLRDLLFEKAQLLSDLLNQHESVKSELAAELHDSVIADLLLLKREIEAKRDIPPERICSALEEVVLNLREVCAELSSRELKHWGLVHALAELCQRLSEKSGQSIDFVCPQNADVILPYSACLHIYRVAQEVLNNALKHAEAKHIRVKLDKTSNELILSVTDDGIGFSSIPIRQAHEGGMGIPILKERSEMLTSMGYASVIGLNSQTGSGTTITLTVDLSSAPV